MLKKIAVTGPESTGKTTLTRLLAAHYEAPWVPEYARQYLEKLGRPYQEHDLDHIARHQLQEEDRMAQEAKNLLFCDTEMLVMKVWSEHSYQRVSTFIQQELERRTYDLYLLCDIDIPWEPDALREHPELRSYFYAVYKKNLQLLGRHFVELHGNYDQRVKKACEAIDRLR